MTFHLRKMMQMYFHKVISRKTYIAGSGSGSGYIDQRHGSADPDPDLHCILTTTLLLKIQRLPDVPGTRQLSKPFTRIKTITGEREKTPNENIKFCK